MAGLWAIYRRELSGYVNTPGAYIFLAAFLILSAGLTFQGGGFFESSSADLTAFFALHPWLLMILAPALSMRSWADEMRHGTIETLLTLPVLTWNLVLGKHLAAWTITAFGLLLTIPLWLTVNYLGEPDNAAIAASYLMSLLAAGAYLALGQACSAITGNQAAAFVTSILFGLFFTAAGSPAITDAAARAIGPTAADLVAPFGIAARLEPAWRGVLDMGAAIYFFGFAILWLCISTLFASARRGG
ncbi:MAG: ABC transporter permease subunit [Caulobacterales bacterium]